MAEKHTQPDTPFAEILKRARAGDRDALEQLFSRSRPMMAAMATKRVGSKPLGGSRPSDIAQDAALLAFDHLAAFKGETEAEWQAWVASILRNRTKQALRDAGRKKRQAERTLPLDDREAQAAPAQQVTPSQVTAHNEEWRQVLTYIYELPAAQKDAIWLCHLEELTIAEVARIMNRTEAAVAGLLQRGLRNLRRRAEVRAADVDDEIGVSNEAGSEDAATALLTFIRRRDAGESLTIDNFLAEHTSCAQDLRPMLVWIERIQSIRERGRVTR